MTPRPTDTIRLFLIAAGVLIVSLDSATPAWGQLFGERTTGQPLQMRSGPGRTGGGGGGEETVGTIQGDDRFLRENRARGEFVGSDRRSTQGFIGSQQALGSGRVRAATESLQPPEDTSARVNRPLPPLPEGEIQYPKLVLGEEFTDPGPGSGEAPSASGAVLPPPRPAPEIEERLRRHTGGVIRVYRDGERAILEGTVSSREVAERLKLIASFEPRVYRVEDRLRIDGDGPSGERRQFRGSARDGK